MIKSVARVFKFSPDIIGKMYFEENADDFECIYFWHLDAMEYIKEINKSGGGGI